MYKLISSRVAVASLLGLMACDGGSGDIDRLPPDLETSSLAASPVNQMVVVNTPANPVPTVATGTTAVSGTVGISGTPNVNATVVGTPTVNAVLAGTPSVNATITGTPAVNATITGTPSVNATIAGTPSVNATIAGTPTVNLGGPIEAVQAGPWAVSFAAGSETTVKIGNTAASPALVRDVDRTTTTHVGVPVGRLMNIQVIAPNNGTQPYFRYDGAQLGGTDFVVPAGYSFVATDPSVPTYVRRRPPEV